MAADLQSRMFMKTRTRMVDVFSFLVFIIFLVWGCAQRIVPVIPDPEPQPESTQVPPEELGAVILPVTGNAAFGSQCPYGTFSQFQPGTLELYSCPIHLQQAELLEPLQPIVLQADCKKKLMDVRGPDRSFPSGTWEVHPDNTFFFRLEGGLAKLKNDGHGTGSCAVRLTAVLSGNMECQDRDKVGINLETVWFLGEPTASPSPIVGNTNLPPNSAPHPEPVPIEHHIGYPPFSNSGIIHPPIWPSHRFSAADSSFDPRSPSSPIPDASPDPISTASPAPDDHFPFPGETPVVRPSVVPQPRPADSLGNLPPCQLPPGCYFYNKIRIDQCS